jgi:hypothetical protein
MNRISKITVFFLAAASCSPAAAQSINQAGFSAGEGILLFILASAMVLIAVIVYVLRLTARVGGASGETRPGEPSTAPERFGSYLTDLESHQIEALSRLTDTKHKFNPLTISDHAKEQFV